MITILVVISNVYASDDNALNDNMSNDKNLDLNSYSQIEYDNKIIKNNSYI